METLMLMFSKNWGGIDSARPAPRSSTSLWLPKNAPGIFVQPEGIVKLLPYRYKLKSPLAYLYF
jgi:hypothetical protein